MRATACLTFLFLVAPASAQSARTRQPDVRYVPSPDSVVDAMLALAHVTAGDAVYDLGSGDGRIPIAAAKQWPPEKSQDLNELMIYMCTIR